MPLAIRPKIMARYDTHSTHTYNETYNDINSYKRVIVSYDDRKLVHYCLVERIRIHRRSFFVS